MTINERIRKLRKEHLKMSQKDFASLIGMKQTSVSSFEKIGATVTDQTIKSICFAVKNLNEDWLRTGNGEMIIEDSTFSLDEYARSHGASSLEIEILKNYFDLDPETRKSLIELFRGRISSTPAAAPISEQKETVEDAEEEYKKSVLNSAQKKVYTASSITEDTEAGRKIVNDK